MRENISYQSSLNSDEGPSEVHDTYPDNELVKDPNESGSPKKPLKAFGATGIISVKGEIIVLFNEGKFDKKDNIAPSESPIERWNKDLGEPDYTFIGRL